jgi:hypothetical protein
LLAEEVMAPLTSEDDRAFLISQINRLSGYTNRHERLRHIFGGFGITIDDDLLERILTAATSSNVAQFIHQLRVADKNMGGVFRTSVASSELSARGGSGSARVQGTPFGDTGNSSGESASDAAVAVTRGPDAATPRFRPGPGDNTQDANAFIPVLRRPDAIMDLEGAGAAAADAAADADQTQTQAVIDGAATVTAAAAAAAKPNSDDDSAPAHSRKRQHSDADDDRKPPAK